MKWDRGIINYDNLMRESRRIRTCQESNHLRFDEIEAYASILEEIACAIGNSQPKPIGSAKGQSVETIAELQKIADAMQEDRLQRSIDLVSKLPTSADT